MAKENISKEELLKIIKHQKKVIENYESISNFYRTAKNFPFIGRTFRLTAGVLKSGQGKSTKVIDCVKNNNPELIGICNPNFRGVKSATYALTSDVVEVSEIFSRKEAQRIAKKIVSFNPNKILLSGYPLGYDLLAEELNIINPDLKILLFVHSAFLWFDVFPAENQVFNRMLELQKTGVIEKIGFCKKDLAVYFKDLGYNAQFVMNRFRTNQETHRLNNKTIKVGVWGQNLWHRNILNQVIAALMLPNTEVHVNEIGDHEFLDKKRITVHGFLPKNEFLKVFQEMDINLYISLTDCFPMTLIESMAFGIPALASDTSDVYSFDKKLKEKLTVSTIDGPIGIANKLKEVLKDYTEIQQEIGRYLPVLNKEVEKSIVNFLE